MIMDKDVSRLPLARRREGLEERGYAMVWFKACPRCRTGDVIREWDLESFYYLCLQCGYVKEPSIQLAHAMAPGRRDHQERMAQPA